MKHKVGDPVRIRSKEWMDAHGKNKPPFVPDMFDYAGQISTITMVDDDETYKLAVDGEEYWWKDWMFDPDYSEGGPLEEEDAIKAMLDGDTLYDREGNPRRFSDDEIESFMRLYRIPPKRKRLMNRGEAMDWAGSEASRGWAVRNAYPDGSTSDWSPPQYFQYSEDIEHYQRVRVRPDLSGVDEDTIQGFEEEE
ncbi:MAG: hypothetical protein LBG27_10110 [Spirochaetaceae bacterium]|jgi:hypothetical protein|nr:hypothetical protein [Spirochaetaceae bacterium]